MSELRTVNCIATCDTCGGRVIIKDVIALFVGEYETPKGRYVSLELCFWVFCKDCGTQITEINIYSRRGNIMNEDKKAYQSPAIIYEGDIETKAGSSLSPDIDIFFPNQEE